MTAAVGMGRPPTSQWLVVGEVGEIALRDRPLRQGGVCDPQYGCGATCLLP